MPPMRTAIALALPLLLLACGAEAPTGPVAADSGADAAADATPDAACDFTRQRLVPGRGCVSATAENCDGRACARGMICNDETSPDGGTVFLCIQDPGG